jgi:hypothetical protein
MHCRAKLHGQLLCNYVAQSVVSRLITKYTLSVLSRCWHDLATKKKKKALKEILITHFVKK